MDGWEQPDTGGARPGTSAPLVSSVLEGRPPKGLVGSRPWDLGLRGSRGRLRVSVMYLRGFF